MKGLSCALRLQRDDFGLDLEFDAAPGVTALFGRSGCGKSTALRCLAGLARAQGRVQLDGETWQDDARGVFLSTHRRPLGFVFQQPELFAHMAVQCNLEFGLRRTPAARRRVVWEQAIALLGIDALLKRGVAHLSGGERQRVAIARTLLTSPRLLLMDEPLSALDVTSKAAILPYLERLHRELDIPVIYVSHAPDEVVRLADRVALMRDGRIVETGPLAELLAAGRLPLGGQPGDAGVIIDGTLGEADAEQGLSAIHFADGVFRIALDPAAEPGTPARLRVHASDVSIALHDHSGETSILNVFPARIAEIAGDGPTLSVRLDLGSTALLASITRHSREHLGLHEGQRVYAQVKAVALLD
ncbi:molybdenum ABC transporter ATP-binding protein [Acidihalobacter aeolianus]|uniref:Molybdenum ABC transporter ATP-binding protein n=1 Tax=Acidihalobacter aeolianus TaxID=2792603 RepID=A0A1D8KA01_9GAMM|nr:molybdenum ABC transporter ATP-binding protein [Acidihalobacter aeolianus]AOV17785.1 molybdenum ABC transporter ATP-binding protein [Acidihalobacter aeolianus]